MDSCICEVWGAWALPPCSGGDARTQHGLSPTRSLLLPVLGRHGFNSILAVALVASEQEGGLEPRVGSGSADCIWSPAKGAPRVGIFRFALHGVPFRGLENTSVTRQLPLFSPRS